MARIEGVRPEEADESAQPAFAYQEKRWGGPLLPHLVYARRPTIYRGVRGMFAGLDRSGLLGTALVSLINRRVAAINGCEF